MFWNAGLKCFLMVSVGDFKLSGTSTGLKKAWARIRKAIESDGPAAAVILRVLPPHS